MIEQTRAERIAAARRALADAKAADPAAVDRFEARMARLTAAAKRERERFETRVLGRSPEPPPLPKKPAGMSKRQWKVEKARLRAEAAKDATLALKWAHKQGTPETLERLSTHHVDSLDQLERNGTINKEQREWAAQIANVHRSIEADVAVTVASLEARVDQSRSSLHLVGESIHRVRLHHAYTLWREALPMPKALVLDMIVGDAVGYSVAARRYRVHARKAKRMLIEAIDRWPAMVDRVYRTVPDDEIERMRTA